MLEAFYVTRLSKYTSLIFYSAGIHTTEKKKENDMKQHENRGSYTMATPNISGRAV